MTDYARFQLQENLKTAAVYALTFGVIILLAIGIGTLINHGNVRIGPAAWSRVGRC